MNEPTIEIDEGSKDSQDNVLKWSMVYHKLSEPKIEHFYRDGKWAACISEHGWYYNEKDVEIAILHWAMIENTGFSYEEEHF